MADPRVKYVFTRIADNLNFADSSPVDSWSDGISLDDNKKIMDFFADEKKPALFFYVTEKDPLNMTVSDDPTEYPGPEVTYVPYVLKTDTEKSSQITSSNIEQALVCGIIVGDPTESFSCLYSKALSPVLHTQVDTLDSSIDKRKLQMMVASNERKIQTIASTVTATRKAVKLEPPPDLFGVTTESSSILQASHDDTIVHAFAQHLQKWIRQVQILLSETEQVRQEDEASGPRAEMDYWRERLSIFSSLVESIKLETTRIVVTVLRIRKHKHIDAWNELDKKITECANEAKDNVKFLASLEKYTELLYALDPSECVELIDGLISSVSMVHNISRYYKSPQRVCTLLKKVTNQMINTCVRYIRSGGELYEQDRAKLIQKFRECINLNEQYQSVYNKTLKTKVLSQTSNNPNAKEGSERELKTHFIIFGKYDAFSSRCQNLIRLFTTIGEFVNLGSCRIEGMSNIVRKFTEDIDFTKRSTYNMLDPRLKTFDDEYSIFQKNCNSLDQQIKQVIADAFGTTDTPLTAFRLHEYLVQAITREAGKVELDKWFQKTLQRYTEDLDLVGNKNTGWFKVYRDNPPQTKNMPPIANKISWVRQLMSRINEPMKIISKYDWVFTTEKKKNLVESYNRILVNLTVYEKKCFEQFAEEASQLKKEMQKNLIKMNQNHVLQVNFSPEVMRTFQEIAVFQRFEFDLPEGLDSFLNQEARLRATRTELQNLLNRHDNILFQINDTFPDLFNSAKDQLAEAINPGLTTLTWSSLNNEKFISRLDEKISLIEDAIKKVNDIRTFSINKSLQEISETRLWPEVTESFSEPHILIDAVKHHAIEAARYINARIQGIQASLCEILNIISTVSDIGKIMDDGSKLVFKLNKEDNIMVVGTIDVWRAYKVYEEITFRAIVKCFRASMSELTKTLRSSASGSPTLFCAEVKPSVPELTIFPDLDNLQSTLNECVKWMLKATQGIDTFPQAQFINALLEQAKAQRHAQERERDEDGDQHGLVPAQPQDIYPRTYFSALTRDYPTIALIISMTNQMRVFSTNFKEYVVRFAAYSFLWESDGDAAFEEFEAKQPSLRQIKEKMDKFLELETKIEEVEEKSRVGPILLDSSGVKEALIAEARKWKQKYGDLLNKIGRTKLIELSDFIEKSKASLSKGISVLEDLRSAMDALKRVREKSAEIDQLMSPIDESYSLLAKYGITVPQEELDQYEGLSYNWKKLRSLEQQQQETLQKVSPQFKSQVVEGMAQFLEEFKQFQIQYNEEGPMAPGLTPAEASEKLKIFQHQFDNFLKRWQTYSGGQELFGLERTKLDSIDEMKKQFRNLTQLYGLYSEVNSYTRGIRDLLWIDVKFADVEQVMSEFQTKARRLPAEMKTWNAYIDLQSRIDNFVETMPLLEALSNPAVQDVHWKQIIELTGVEIDTDPDTFRLGHVFDAGLLNFKEDVHDICNAAEQEAKINAKLREIEIDWQSTEFTFSPFRGMDDMLLKGAETQEIITKIEDSIVALSGLNSNRFVGRYKKEVEGWMKKLTVSGDVINEWLQVQSMWIYLEAVFSGGDIAKYMTNETKAFGQINKNWMTVMKNASDAKNVVAVCYGDEGLQKLFKHLLEQLQKCQKALAGYIEKKRACFPRFYFVSDPTILEILGQASNPQAIQPHLQSIFDNLVHLDFDSVVYNKVLGFRSGEGEMVTLTTPFLAQDNVEKWLNDLIAKMRQTIRDICTDMSQHIQSFTVENWVTAEFPAQILLLAMIIWWTERTEDTLRRANGRNSKIFNETKDEFRMRFNTLVRIAGELDKSNKIRSLHVEVLITLFLHNYDIYCQLVDARIKSPRDFDWQKQMRYSWQPDGRKCIVSITDVDREYSYEYLGVTPRLVITPLTDRCYITLAQALGLCMGGAPAGPAGTGKTETVKDMAKAIGIFCVVFNCSDQMNYQALGRIFRGLAQAGVWGDFDEFNRIELDVLSVAAQQVATIFNAQRERQRLFKFTDGSMVELDNRVAIFITMNPGYAGRQELPENLKIQFRMVAMMVPDRRLIMKVKLASSGFQRYDELADKFALLYQLCAEQLSKQIHYDWGLRNILSVLRFSKEVRAANPTMNELELLNRVLMNMNLSKLVDDDEPLFLALLQDVFGARPNQQPDEAIKQALIRNANESNIDPFGEWLAKAIQLQETCEVRHGIMMLGPSGSGKTAILNTLIKAYSDERGPHKFTRMNPKAITSSQMFGTLDPSSNDWTDGIFSALWRIACKRTNEYMWIGLDGPIDAVWIENLNSVLDDNKLLTLANGDRLPMAPTVKLLFEISSLDNASPATVSRAGMIYVPSRILTWKPLAMCWVHREDFKPIEKIFPDLISSFDKLFTYVFKSLSMVMKTSHVHVITTLLNIFEALISTRDDDGYIKLNCQDPETLKKLMVFSAMWAFGGFLDLEGRAKLSVWMTKEYASIIPDTVEKDRLFNYVVDLESGGEWVSWDTRVTPYEYPKDEVPPFSSILIPTVDNTQIQYLMKLLAYGGRSVLLMGETGTAKTATINTFLDSFDKDKWVTKTFGFSSATTPYLFQTSIESIIEKTIGTTYGPPGGKRMEVFIDDISMPLINEWGDQVTNEIVRQLMEDGGFYSLEKPGEFTNVVKTQFIAAMCTPGGGRNDVPDRLKRHFAVFNCTMPDNESIDRIYATIIRGYFIPERGFSVGVCELASKVVDATRSIWQMTKVKMLPTPTKFHYVFNLRDLSRVTQGLLQATDKTMNTPEQFVALWAHECFRVFPDKFTTEQDKSWFADALVKVGVETFGDGFENVLSTADERLFCSFMSDIDYSQYEGVDESKIPRLYEQVPSYEQLNKRCVEFMREFNSKPASKGKKIDLVLFDDAMNHLVRISRIIGMPRGHAMLVGVGGSGKQSLTRLASTILDYSIFQVTPGRNYTTNDFLNDLRELYRRAGVTNKPTTFIFTDNEVKEEGFLEFINNIITTGEIANLFNRDTLDALMSDMRPIFIKERKGQVDTDANVWAFFIERVRQNLHVVLCFSPVGEQFRKRSLKFPGIFSGCTIDWFTHWPHQGLLSVASSFLEPLEIISQQSNIKESVAETFACIHESVHHGCEDYFSRFRRRTYVTPKSYLSFLASFKTLYFDQLKKIQGDAMRMKEGLQKIEDAKVQVAEMKGQLVEEENDLHQKQQRTEELLEGLTVKRADAEVQRASVQEEKDKQMVQKNEIAAIQAKANQELAVAQPKLDAALNALDSIKQGDISELATYPTLGPILKLILDCVLILLKGRLNPYKEEELKGVPSIVSSVEFGQALLKNSSFLSTLKNYPLSQINDEMCDLMAPYLALPFFNANDAKGNSAAAAGLCDWVINVVGYHGVEKFVRPIQLAADTASANLRKAEKDLAVIEEQLAAKEASLAELQHEFDMAMAEQNKCKQKAEATQKKLRDAQALIDALSGEKGRWENQAAMLQESIYKTVGNATIGAAFNSYCGMFNHTMRNHFLNDAWPEILTQNSIPSEGKIEIISLFVSEATLDTWQLQGLPSDELSRQNGVICTNAPTYPLLIDPQGQAHSWICNAHGKELIVTSFEHRYFRSHLENALQNGKPLLIEDCGEEIDPILDNVLAKNFMPVGRSFQVSLAGRDVLVSDGFKLFLTTKLANPMFAPETFAKCSVIEFSVTQNGLTEQLLNLVVLREKESLETERQRLLAQVASLKAMLVDLENQLLELLRSSEGNLLENTSLITTLNTTKIKSQENTEALNTAMETNQKINNSRREYLPVAVRGAVLYFLIQEMSQVNVMYQVSLNQFLGKFFEAIETAEPDTYPQNRIRNIINTLTITIYHYIVRGLYERDKLLFCLQLALKVELSLNVFDFNDYQIFIKGGAAATGGDKLNDIQLPEFFSSVRDNVLALSQISLFKGHFAEIVENGSEWRKIMESPTPEQETIPKICEGMQPFHRAVVIRCLRPDRAIFAANQYISETLGKEFIEYPAISLDKISVEAGNKSPVIFLLSPGSDPTPLVEEAARKAKVQLNSVSMGQGREEFAEAYIQQSKAKGEWVLLQNCHLGLRYMNALFEMYKQDLSGASADSEKKKEGSEEQKEEKVDPKKAAEKPKQIHEDYRLWITTEVHPKFPVSLLQLSLKLTNEPPAGAKASMKRTLSSITQQTIDTLECPEWRKLIYVLAFFNTTVQERRKFGPLGWCIPYEFNHSDFTASLSFCSGQVVDAQRQYSSANANPNPFVESFWQTVRYGICEIHYGGRVTDELDRRLINAIGESYFCNERVFEVSKAIRYFDRPEYPIFDCASVGQFLEQVNKLPQNDPPPIFGLHDLADVKLRRDQANEVFQKIIDVQPKESASGGMTREDVVTKKIQELLPEVPEDFNMEYVRKQVEDNGRKPLDICCKQEIERMQIVLRTLRSTLVDLGLAIDGTIVMNDQLYNSMNSLFDGRIPEHWLKISWPAESLKSWFDEVKLRYDQYTRWIANSQKVDAFWLGGMFNPGGFLTSLRQNTGRDNGWKLDECFIESEVQSPGRSNRDGGEPESNKRFKITYIYVKGLWIEGARWYRTISANQVANWGLTELASVSGRGKNAKMVTDLRSEMPLIKLWAMHHDKGAKVSTTLPLSKQSVYQAPVYKYAARTDINYIFSIPLHSSEAKSALHWTLRGVCLTTK